MATLDTLKRKNSIVYQIRYLYHGHRYKTPILRLLLAQVLLLKEQIENDIGLDRAGLKIFQHPFERSKENDFTISEYRTLFFKHKKTAKRKGGPVYRTLETYDREFDLLEDAIGKDATTSTIKDLTPTDPAFHTGACGLGPC